MNDEIIESGNNGFIMHPLQIYMDSLEMVQNQGNLVATNLKEFLGE